MSIALVMVTKHLVSKLIMMVQLIFYTKITDVLGKYHFKRRTVRLWENLAQEKFIDRGENNFIGFCNKIIFLSEGMFRNIFVKDAKIVFHEKYYHNIFNNLSDKTIVCK